MLSKDQEKIILNTTKELYPTYIGIFGSYARGEENQQSDLDILIDFKDTKNLIEIIGIEQELSEKLGIKVDLITIKSLNKLVKPYIENDIIRIL